MKIVTTDIHPRYAGLMLAAREVVGDESIKHWEPQHKPIFDMLAEVEPDVLCCDIKYVDSPFVRACAESDVKPVLFNEGIPQNFNPAVVVAKPSTSPVIRKHIEGPGHKTIYMKDYANVCAYWGGERENNMACDIGYVSLDADPERVQNRVKAIAQLVSHGIVRIVGDVRMPLPQFLGTIRHDRIATLMKSSTIFLDFDSEWILDVAANGAFALSATPNKLFPTLSDNAVKGFLQDDKKRHKIARKAQRLVLDADTSYHRLTELMIALDEPDLAGLAITKTDELRKQCEQE